MIFTILKAPEGMEAGLRELLAWKGHELAETAGAGSIALTLLPCEEKKVQASYYAAPSAAEEAVPSGRTPADSAKAAQAGSAVLETCDRTFFFRALMTLVRELEKRGTAESFTETEKVFLDKNGTMLDCSRNSVLTVETIKEYIRMQASLGMNTLMLYTEDTYEVPEYPYFGAYRGRYTGKELEEMVDYADLFGIEMIPCIQALAHLHNALRWNAMQELQDTDDILMVGDPKVYAFVKACIQNAVKHFHTKRVHLGMDEAWSLGLGRYLHRNGFHPKSEIMAEHLEKTSQICRELGLEPMIWSDMYLRLCSENNEYYDIPLDSDLSGAVKPPEEVGLVYWDYYHTDENFYRQYLRMHRQLSDKVIFAGGGWVWNGLTPNLKGAVETTEPGMSACKAAGVREAVCTMWQDDGAETPMAAGISSIIRFAEHGFAENVTQEHMKEQFEFLTGESWESCCVIGEIDGGAPGRTFYDNPSKYLLYQDAMLGLFDAQIDGWDVKAYYEGRRDELLRLRKGGDSVASQVTELYIRLTDALAVKAGLGLRISAAYAAGDREALGRIAGQEIPDCIAKIKAYRDCREELWSRESKIFGFEVLDIRFGGLTARLESAAKRLAAYAQGELECLPELEETRLPFRPVQEGSKDTLCACNIWKTIVSASQI